MLLLELFLLEQQIGDAGWYSPTENRYVEVGDETHEQFVVDNPKLFGLSAADLEFHPEYRAYEVRDIYGFFEWWVRCVRLEGDLNFEGAKMSLARPNTLRFILSEVKDSFIKVNIDMLNPRESVTFQMPAQKGKMIRWFKAL